MMATATYHRFIEDDSGYTDEQLIEKIRSGGVISLAHPQYIFLGFIFPDSKNPDTKESIYEVVLYGYGEQPKPCTHDTLPDMLKSLRVRGFIPGLSKDGAYRINIDFK
jgi:hypothetical protein